MGFGQRPQVMVVDDDLAMCGFLRTFLASRGYEALTITNADEAVRRFQNDRPTAVLLDVVLPGLMDGLAALAAFKKIDKEIPIIVISGQGRTSTVVQAMKLGATDFVCKPFDDSELEAVVAHVTTTPSSSNPSSSASNAAPSPGRFSRSPESSSSRTTAPSSSTRLGR